MGPDGSGFENAGDAKLGKYISERKTPIKALFSLTLLEKHFQRAEETGRGQHPLGL